MQWGSLYNPSAGEGKSQDYERRIETLQKEIDKLQIPRMNTVSKTSYKHFVGYQEWHNHKRRSIDKVKQNESQNSAL